MINLIRRRSTIKWKLQEAHCINHINQKEFCKFTQTKSNKTELIYDKKSPIEVNSVFVSCNQRPKKIFNVLSQSHLFILSPSSNKNNYVTVNDEKVLKIKSKYITFGLLLHLNQIAINGQSMMWGMSK